MNDLKSDEANALKMPLFAEAIDFTNGTWNPRVKRMVGG